MKSSPSKSAHDKKAAIIEFGSVHDECIYSQVRFLKEGGFKVFLILNEKLDGRVAVNDSEGHLIIKASLSGVIDAIKYLWRNKIHYVILNTCSGNKARWFALLLLGRFNITGIHHNGNKLENRFSQYPILWRVKKYFVLNDYIKEQIKITTNISVQSFYPIFHEAALQPSPNVKRDYLSICIPGALERKRRDYELLFEIINSKNVNGIQFTILGRTNVDGEDFKWLRQKMIETGLEENIIYFNDFVPEDTFYRIIAESDLIMPLIHPSKKEYEAYGKYKIAGAFNLAFGFKKPLLMESFWSEYDDFKKNSLFYSRESLPSILGELAKNPQALETLRMSYENHTKFHFSEQAKRYLEFVQL